MKPPITWGQLDWFARVVGQAMPRRLPLMIGKNKGTWEGRLCRNPASPSHGCATDSNQFPGFQTVTCSNEKYIHIHTYIYIYTRVERSQLLDVPENLKDVSFKCCPGVFFSTLRMRHESSPTAHCAGNLTQGKAGNQLMALRFCKGFALQAGPVADPPGINNWNRWEKMAFWHWRCSLA